MTRQEIIDKRDSYERERIKWRQKQDYATGEHLQYCINQADYYADQVNQMQRILDELDEL